MTLMQLQHLVESSNLSWDDKDLWMRLMEAMDDDAATTVVESLTGDEDPAGALEDMTRSIKRKRDVLTTGDAVAFSHIVDEEVKTIRDL